MRIRCVLTSLMFWSVIAAAETTISGVTEGGIPYVEKIDSIEHSCGEGNDACTTYYPTPIIWTKSNTRETVKRHERGHVDGLRHSEWEYPFGAWKGIVCSTVVVGDITSKYQTGDFICLHHNSDETITRRTK